PQVRTLRPRKPQKVAPPTPHVYQRSPQRNLGEHTLKQPHVRVLEPVLVVLVVVRRSILLRMPNTLRPRKGMRTLSAPIKLRIGMAGHSEAVGSRTKDTVHISGKALSVPNPPPYRSFNLSNPRPPHCHPTAKTKH